MTIAFNVHGIVCRVACDDEELLSDLRRDFDYFSVSEGAPPDVTVDVFLGSPPPGALPRGAPTFRWRGARIHDRGPLRRVVYGEGALGIYRYDREKGELFSGDRALLHELAYLMIHSRVGELLDRRGIHRLHALGLAVRGAAVLLFLPEGGGKTTLGLRMLGDIPGARLLSDDTPLVAPGGWILPFPIRLGVRAGEVPSWVARRHVRSFLRRRHGIKELIDIDALGGRIGTPCRRSVLVAGIRTAGEPSIAPCRRAAWRLVRDATTGAGLPQVLEYFARPSLGDLARKAWIARRRFIASLRLARRSRVYRFRTGDDLSRSAEALGDFLGRI